GARPPVGRVAVSASPRSCRNQRITTATHSGGSHRRPLHHRCRRCRFGRVVAGVRFLAEERVADDVLLDGLPGIRGEPQQVRQAVVVGVGTSLSHGGISNGTVLSGCAASRSGPWTVTFASAPWSGHVSAAIVPKSSVVPLVTNPTPVVATAAMTMTVPVAARTRRPREVCHGAGARAGVRAVIIARDGSKSGPCSSSDWYSGVKPVASPTVSSASSALRSLPARIRRRSWSSFCRDDRLDTGAPGQSRRGRPPFAVDAAAVEQQERQPRQLVEIVTGHVFPPPSASFGSITYQSPHAVRFGVYDVPSADLADGLHARMTYSTARVSLLCVPAGR